MAAPDPDRAHRGRRRSRRGRIVLGALAVLAVLVTGAVVVVGRIDAAADADHADRAAEVAARALALLADEPPRDDGVDAAEDAALPLLLAVEAHRLHDDETTRSALYRVAVAAGVTQRDQPVLLPGGDTAVAAEGARIAINPSGTGLLVVDADGAAVTALPDGAITRVVLPTEVAADPRPAPAGQVDVDGRLGLASANWWSDDQLVGWSSVLGQVVVVGGPTYGAVQQQAVPDAELAGTPVLVQRRGGERLDVALVTADLAVTTVNTRTGGTVWTSTALAEAAERLGADGAGIRAFAIDHDLAYGAVLADDGRVELVALATGDVLADASDVEAIAFDSTDGLIAIGADTTRRYDTDVFAWAPWLPLGDAVVGAASEPQLAAKDAAVAVLEAPAADAATGTVHLRTLLPAEWVAAACQEAGRPLTRTEWRHYVGGDPPENLACDR